MHYVAVIDKDANSAYGIRFSGLPGCFSVADTFDEIFPQGDRGAGLVFRRP